MQRAFRLRRAEHLAALEERINLLESENTQLRALLSLPEADRAKIGSGPTGRGKSVKDGGVPMSERVRARKEARERERRAKGLPDPTESSEHDSDMKSTRGESATLSPAAHTTGVSGPSSANGPSASILFGNQGENSPAFSYQLPMQFGLGNVQNDAYPDFSAQANTTLNAEMFKPNQPNGGQAFSNMFGMFDTPNSTSSPAASTTQHRSPMPTGLSTPVTAPASGAGGGAPQTPGAPQPDLLTRLKSCCHLSDSHVVNDPGLLIFATRLCQSFPCSLSGAHPEDATVVSDSEFLLLEDSWKALKAQLDPGGDADGEHRINTGRMAAELVCRAASSRGPGWIICRFREGMSIKRSMVAQLIQGFGGKFE